MSLLGAILGVAAAATVVGVATYVICNKLSAREQRRQDEMRNSYYEYESERRAQYRTTVSYYNQQSIQKQEEYERRRQEARREQIRKLRETNQPLYNQYVSNLEEQRKEKNNLHKQLSDAIEKWKQINVKEQQTYVRHASVKSSILSIQEAMYKIEAYIKYLDDYHNELKSKFDSEGLIPEPFSMVLPNDYPYIGMVYSLSKKDLKTDRKGKYFFEYKIIDEKSRIYLSDYESDLISDFENNHEFPSMVIGTKNNDRLFLSISRGIMACSVNSSDGIIAEVITILPRFAVRLSYHGVIMLLHNSDRQNAKRGMPVGSKVRVFLKDYDYSFNKVDVTEKYEDSIKIAKFEKIPMIGTSEQYHDFRKYLYDNNYQDIDDEWRIGPCDESSDSSDKKMKFQMGMYYGFLVEFVDCEESDAKYLKMIRMLDKREFLKFEDVYAVAQTSVNVSFKNISEFDSEMKKECGLLYIYLLNEFAAQRKIAQNSVMSLYFSQWGELTKRLIDYKQYGNYINISVLDWEYSIFSGKQFTRFYFEKNNKIEKFLRNGDDRTRYFIHVIKETGKEINIPCRLDVEDEYGTVHVNGEISDIEIQNMDYSIRVYEKATVVAEQRQLKALENFRKGQCTSYNLKELILNIDELIYNDNNVKITKLFNASINENVRQSKAICGAMRSKDFYMIQGPPGTGKTTVIKELVLQVLSQNKYARVLVVSQANVAVDNVLRGIIDICNDTQGIDIDTRMIIRCGNVDRMDELLKEEYSYGNFQKRYLKSLESECDFPEERIKWKTIINNPDNKDIFSEWLLKGFQIIGATCVGLEGEYGLSNIDFDLVVIDEAGKALPGELLIPINHAKRLVVIGDHKQLPPVIDPLLYQDSEVETDDIISDNEQDFFNRSFFERLWDDCPDTNKCTLNMQFRMPPVISGLVNLFYDGELLDGECCKYKKPMMLGSNLIYIDMSSDKDYHEVQQKNRGPSNPRESEVLACIVKRIVPNYHKRIVVITPYKEQKRNLIRQLKTVGLSAQVRVDTIDAFQGDEEDVVVFCTTRSRKKTNYFGDNARLNVAFSRARNTLIIIGDIRYFSKYPEGMKIRDVGTYIKNHARIIPYNEYISEDFNLEFNEYYATEVVNNSYVKNSYLSAVIEEMDKKYSAINSVRNCEFCGSMLSEDEEIVCYNCFDKYIDCRCESCGKTIDYSVKDKYIRKIPKPFVCDSCIQTNCINCQKMIYVPKFKIKLATCNSCSAFECIKCGKTISFPKNQKMKSTKMCNDCFVYYEEKKNVGNCSVCNEEVYSTQEMIEKDGVKKPLYCNTCFHYFGYRKEVGKCDSCGKKIFMTNDELTRNNNQPRNLCNWCILACCDVCGTEFYSKQNWYNTLKKDGKAVLCQKCQTSTYDTMNCRDCGRQYSITYGEKTSFDSKGLSLPKRCPDCRKNKTRY